jgi:hypothetical protein
MDPNSQESMSESRENQRRKSGFLEWGLAGALIVLNVQMMPRPGKTLGSLLGVLDVRQWTQSTWLIFSIIVVAMLSTVRFGREVKIAWIQSRANAALKRAYSGQGKQNQQETELHDPDYEARRQRDRDWRERAKKRKPFS